MVGVIELGEGWFAIVRMCKERSFSQSVAEKRYTSNGTVTDCCLVKAPKLSALRSWNTSVNAVRMCADVTMTGTPILETRM
jgi:hypothetical protein